MQLYTALVYDGLALVPAILDGLDALLARDGFATVADAVGTGRDRLARGRSSHTLRDHWLTLRNTWGGLTPYS